MTLKANKIETSSNSYHVQAKKTESHANVFDKKEEKRVKALQKEIRAKEAPSLSAEKLHEYNDKHINIFDKKAVKEEAKRVITLEKEIRTLKTPSPKEVEATKKAYEAAHPSLMTKFKNRWTSLFTNTKKSGKPEKIEKVENAKKSEKSKKPKGASIVARTQAEVIKLTGLRKPFLDTMESFEGKRYVVYKDVARKVTNGIGHNVSADKNYPFVKTVEKNSIKIIKGKKVKTVEKTKVYSKINDKHVYTFFAEDLIGKMASIKEYTKGIKLSSGQMEALVDLAFNVGEGNLKASNLIKYIKEKDFKKAKKELNYIAAKVYDPKTKKATLKVVPNLCKRRIYDINRFCDGKPTKQDVVAMEAIRQKGISAIQEKIKEAHKKKDLKSKAYYDDRLIVFKRETEGLIHVI